MADAQNQADTSHAKDIAVIETIVASQMDAWNRGDAKAFSAQFAADGSFTNVLGIVYYGHEAFEQRHAELFQTVFKSSKAKMSIRKLRFIRADVAVADVDCEVSGHATLPPGIPAAPDGTVRSRLQLVLVRENGDWGITAFHNVGVAPLPPRRS